MNTTADNARTGSLVTVTLCTATTTVGQYDERGGRRGRPDRLQSIKTREEQTVPATAMFIFIGATSHTGWPDGVVARDEHGFILTGPHLGGHDLKNVAGRPSPSHAGGQRPGRVRRQGRPPWLGQASRLRGGGGLGGGDVHPPLPH